MTTRKIIKALWVRLIHTDNVIMCPYRQCHNVSHKIISIFAFWFFYQISVGQIIFSVNGPAIIFLSYVNNYNSQLFSVCVLSYCGWSASGVLTYDIRHSDTLKLLSFILFLYSTLLYGSLIDLWIFCFDSKEILFVFRLCENIFLPIKK